MNNDFLNIVLAFLFSLAVLFCWNYFVIDHHIDQASEILQHTDNNDQKNNQEEDLEANISDSNHRIPINSSLLSGSINLLGLRFDNLVLNNYRESLDKDSPNIELLSTRAGKRYFVELGFISKNNKLDLPDSKTIWQTNSKELTELHPVTLFYKNKNILIEVKIELDDFYMFKISSKITNLSQDSFEIKNYALINRSIDSLDAQNHSKMSVLHEGFIGTINKKLEELDYDKIKDKTKEQYFNSEVNWIGITDKYWLTALIPDDQFKYDASFKFGSDKERFQTDILSKNIALKANNVIFFNHKVFLGAKNLDILDQYEKQYNIKLFDRAIDFGWFYILTKPIFYSLNFLYKYVKNFGLSIMILTVLIKILMFSLSNKSHKSMKKIKGLAPEIERIKNLYGNDKQKIHQETILLYKREKVNPLSGCLPMIIQIPVFFSIYKVLCVTIEMRHADFFGWINDLSAPDPTNIFTLFGLFSYELPEILQIGAWPIIMAFTMFIQQSLNPKPADPLQAMFIKFMPLIFLFMFNKFPAGLLIYWSWSNFLSILQQLYVNARSK